MRVRAAKSNVSSTPTWKTLPVEQRLPPGFFGSIRDVDVGRRISATASVAEVTNSMLSPLCVVPGKGIAGYAEH
jgi:hypothetical protein